MVKCVFPVHPGTIESSDYIVLGAPEEALLGPYRFVPILNRFTNPERLIRTRSVQTRTRFIKPSNLLALKFGRWILNRLTKPCVYLAKTVFRLAVIGLPNWMVSLNQTISRLAETVLLSIQGVRFGHTNRRKTDH